MYIWPDGSVTGSVNHAVLDAYNKAKDAGEDLSPFEPYLGVLPESEPVAAPEPVVTPEVPVQTAWAGEAEDLPDATDQGDYGDWSLAELQDEAVSRGLPKSGNKSELADRLRQNDEEE